MVSAPDLKIPEERRHAQGQREPRDVLNTSSIIEDQWHEALKRIQLKVNEVLGTSGDPGEVLKILSVSRDEVQYFGALSRI